MQNIKFITQFFLEILQRTAYLLFSVLQACLATFINNDSISLQITVMLICTKKSISSITSFLRYCKDFANILFSVILAGQAMPITMNGVNLWDSLVFIYMQKSTSSLTSFSRYRKDIKLLLWVLEAFLAMTSKNDTNSLQKTLSS